EELPAQILQSLLEALVHAVPDDIEEATLAAGLPDLRRHCPPPFGASDEFIYVDDRNVGEVVRLPHITLLRSMRIPMILRGASHCNSGPPTMPALARQGIE